ncbi:MAG: AMP-binding protein [Polyangiaceae bacterium]
MTIKLVSQVLDDTVKQHGHRVAMRTKRNGVTEISTFSAYREQARAVAKALMAVGMKPGEAVSIIGFNCPEWVLADVGAILAGGMPAGIYTTSSAEQCGYIAGHSESIVAFAENAKQVEKFVEVRGTLPKLKLVVQMIGEPKAGDAGVVSWQAFLKRASEVTDAELDARMAAQKPDDPCTLIYTSGTTGDPKAVMITHANLTCTADRAVTLLGFGAEDRGVSYLPLSHIAEQLLTIHAPMRMGACITFAESLEKVLDANLESRPTYFVGVPRVWEKMQAKILKGVSESSPLKQKIFARARAVGLAAALRAERGEAPGLEYKIFEKLVYAPLRKRLGLDQSRIAVSSAAPIAKATLEFFFSVGIPIFEIFGMSECTGPATISLSSGFKIGKVGRALPGTELKIADDGEVCMRGYHVFAGYLKDKEATKNAIDEEGWLHSGDIGTIDADGFLQITDRKKELLITAGGENVAPQLIEGMLRNIPGVSQAVVVGDRRKYLAALLTLDAERAKQLAEGAGITPTGPKDLATSTEFQRLLDTRIEEMNKELARVQTVKKFTILPVDFSVDGGELTPTLKLKRRVINEKYSQQIEALYAGAD